MVLSFGTLDWEVAVGGGENGARVADGLTWHWSSMEQSAKGEYLVVMASNCSSSC